MTDELEISVTVPDSTAGADMIQYVAETLKWRAEKKGRPLNRPLDGRLPCYGARLKKADLPARTFVYAVYVRTKEIKLLQTFHGRNPLPSAGPGSRSRATLENAGSGPAVSAP